MVQQSNKLLLLILAGTLISIAGCKKGDSSAGTIQFDLSGSHHSFQMGGSFSRYVDSAGNSAKSAVLLSNQNTLPLLGMQFYDAISNQSAPNISNGSYSDSLCNSCKFYLLEYGDNTLGSLAAGGFNFTNANITSSTGTAPVINGTFDCWLSDPSGTVNLHLTNGQINNVPY